MVFFRVICFIFSASSGEDCKRLLRNFVDWFLKLIRVALKRFCVVSLLSTLAFTDLPCETEEWLKQRSRKIDCLKDGNIKNPSHYCVATITEIAGHRLRIRYDGIRESSEFDFCCSFQGDELIMSEWCLGHRYPDWMLCWTLTSTAASFHRYGSIWCLLIDNSRLQVTENVRWILTHYRWSSIDN